MKKISTSRWREAVRSSEVSPEAGQRVMKSLGISPQEWARRLGGGAAELAAAKGYEIVNAPGKAETLPTKQIHIDPKEKSWVLHHEAREAAKMEQLNKALQKNQWRTLRRMGSGERLSPGISQRASRFVRPVAGFLEGVAKPELVEKMRAHFRDFIQLSPDFRSAQHMSFSLPIRDIRESRLLSPETRAEINALRARTGELGDITQAAKARSVEQALLPRHRINQLAHETEKLEHARIESVIKPSPTARRVGAFLRRLLKLK